MNLRRLGTLLLLAVVGVGAGFGVAAMLEDEPTLIKGAAPVAATSPSIPSNPEIEVLDDVDTARLEPNLPMRTEKVGSKPFRTRVPVPKGWNGTVPSPGEWRWYAPDQQRTNTFFLRVRQVGNRFQAVSAALEERIGDLESAESVQDFELEGRSPSSGTFVASYVADGYRRVAMETFVSTNGDDQADVWIAVIGRERDRKGLSDLLSRVTSGVESAD